MRRTILLAAASLALIAAWWFAYGAPASRYFRSQNRLQSALAQSIVDSDEATNLASGSMAAAPTVSVLRSASLRLLPSQLATVQVSCRYYALWGGPETRRTVELAAQSSSGSRDQSTVLDSTEVHRLVQLIDTSMAAATTLRAAGGGVSVSGALNDNLSLLISTGNGRIEPALLIHSDYFFLQERDLRELRAVLAGSWASCLAKAPSR